MHALPVLLTRPAEDSLRLATQLRRFGAQEVVIAPLMRLEVDAALPPIAGGVLLTSRNAVAAFVAGQGAPGLPAWVVGPGTAAEAVKAGFHVRAVAPNVEALVDMVPEDAPALVHLRGVVTRGDLAARLSARGLRVTEAVTYRQAPQPLTPAAISLLRRGPVLVPLYSPRSASLFADACPTEALDHLRLLALSPAVAKACPVCPLAISETPDGEGMLALIRDSLPAIGG
ncbi:uroporphyrinogen-III synthase [Jannaschia faecimaris]|uniref:Uroporphyrinogen-III synthase n=1 Tax=Jannaschia faecimaris TaxID=1244108 RepID=A0A1H3PP91_9RHOB|nr:uroporphyrinogen-III synthase [Jannaschia faecimaris]SDZ02790.1 uroporphyrinogen-III synthase [Jannaschia faecimaris]